MPHLTLLPSASHPKAETTASMSFDLAEALRLVFDEGELPDLERRLDAVRRRRAFRLIPGGEFRCVQDASEDAAV